MTLSLSKGSYYFIVFPAFITWLTNVWLYPNSLSYHARTFTRLPPITLVKLRSAIAPYGLPIISLETSSSSVTEKIPFQRDSLAAFLRILFTSSTVVFFLETKVISAIDPVIIGTRIAIPSKSPESFGKAFVTAIAAPEDVGTQLRPPARTSRRYCLIIL